MANPEVTTLPAIDITPQGATLRLRCDSQGGLATKVMFILWFPYPRNSWNSAKQDVSFDGEYLSLTVEWRDIAVLHSVRAMAENNDGQTYGDLIDFWPLRPSKDWLASGWYVLNYQGECFWPDYSFVCVSDVPCHLTARIGYKAPYRNPQYRFKRGRVTHPPPHIYFTWFMEVEQTEDGDSLLHSFAIPWPESGIELWWYTFGTIDNRISPSISPFFHGVCTAPAYSDACKGGDPWGGSWLLGNTQERAKDFVPTYNYQADKLIGAFRRRVGSTQPPKVKMAIYEVGGDNKPKANPIAYCIADLPDMSDGQMHIVECTGAEITLVKDKRYAIGWVGYPLYRPPPVYMMNLCYGPHGTCWLRNGYFYRNVTGATQGAWGWYSSFNWDFAYSIQEKT